MRHLGIAFLVLLLTTAGGWAEIKMVSHDCLGATSSNTVTIASGSSETGTDVRPLGMTSGLAGFVTLSGSGTLTITIQTRRAGSLIWHTPVQGATPLSAVSAGSHHFTISIPPCEALRLVYTAAGASISITDAFVVDQREE